MNAHILLIVAVAIWVLLLIAACFYCHWRKVRARRQSAEMEQVFSFMMTGSRVECADCGKVMQPGGEPKHYSICRACAPRYANGGVQR